MAYRNSQIYVTTKTKARLYLITECFPYRSKNSADPANYTNATVDEVADQLLNDVIEKQFPGIIELESKMDRAKKEFFTELKAAVKP